MPPNRRSDFHLHPRLRVLRGNVIALGPGKADLLEAIGHAGSLRAAADQLSMSYMRAWKLVQTMNKAFRAPLVTTGRGGSKHGVAALTRMGKEVLVLYRRMERRSLRANDDTFRRLRRLLAD